MKQLYNYIAAVFFLSLLSGCSLLKVDVSTGDPLPKEDMNMRVMTRGLYYKMVDDISQCADSIAGESDDFKVKVAAMKWKIDVTRVGVNAVMQSVPEVALVDFWILSRRMNEGFKKTPDSLLFKEFNPLVRELSSDLNNQVIALAKEVLNNQKYKLMSDFVEKTVNENPRANPNETHNTSYQWMQYLRDNGIEPNYLTGTIAEVLTDVNDRFSGQTQQLSNSLGWSKEIINLYMSQDSTRSQINTKFDTLENQLLRMVIVAENLPEVSDEILNQMSMEFEKMIAEMNTTINMTFVSVDNQRLQLQKYLSKEREIMLDEINKSANELLDKSLEKAPSLIGEIILYVVLAVVVLFGFPFFLGFWLGGIRQKLKYKKKEK